MARLASIPCRSCGVAISKTGRCETCTARHGKEHKASDTARASRAGSRKAYDDRRGSASSRGYDRKWRVARESFILNNPLCVQCEKVGRLTFSAVVDHIIPHRQDRNLFNDQTNWQALCTRCHNQKTAGGE